MQHHSENVVSLAEVAPKVAKGKRRGRKPRTVSANFRRRMARQGYAASAVALVAVVLTGLSLAHLAAGIELVTKASTYEAWAMAVGIDLGFIALEIAQLCGATPATTAAVKRFATPAIVGTLVASAAMNAVAFGAQAEGLLLYPAIGLGLAIPALIYALSRVAFGLATGSRK